MSNSSVAHSPQRVLFAERIFIDRLRVRSWSVNGYSVFGFLQLTAYCYPSISPRVSRFRRNNGSVFESIGSIKRLFRKIYALFAAAEVGVWLQLRMSLFAYNNIDMNKRIWTDTCHGTPGGHYGAINHNI